MSSIRQAARGFGVSTTTLYATWKWYGIERLDGRRRPKPKREPKLTREQAEEAAGMTSTHQAARRFYVSTQTLRNTWEWYGIERLDGRRKVR